MRQQINKKFYATIVSACLAVLFFSSTIYSASIIDGYPGYPNVFEGLTTNTIIRIELDAPVAMIANLPDIDYCVKKATFTGFDFMFSDVVCDVEVSDDRKTLRLYPEDLLDKDSMYAYKVVDINFDGGGSDNNFDKCYATGSNPIPIFDTVVDEADMCSDSTGSLGWGNYCLRCHTDWASSCVITPNDR